MRKPSTILFLFGCLTLAGCGTTDLNAGQCTPACTGGQLCCSEPNHGLTDGGFSSFVCVAPSGGACPALP